MPKVYVCQFNMSFRIRLHPRRALRLLMVVAMVLFVVVNFHIMPDASDEDFRAQESQLMNQELRAIDDMHVQIGRGAENGDDDNMNPNLPVYPKIVIAPAQNHTETVKHNATDAQVNVTDVTEIQQAIERINQEQYVQNMDKFGLTLDADSVVIVVQVHNRYDHLQILLQSLGKVRGIEKVLLIVSHDVFSHELNSLVRGITFCPVLQIFFPHSQQIYHNRFPGEDPNDCPRDMKKEQALEKKCNNAEHPDKYGHYREAKYCQTKHHWIWKLQFVFERVRLLEGYAGHVLLLEEDYFVSEDILFSLKMMQALRNKDCPECRMLVLGNYDKTQNYQVNGGKVERAYWISSKHNMGMAFTRALWAEIKKCAESFCNHDDYNWDWTLQHLSMKCIPNMVRLLKMRATRIYHLGECGGMHTKNKHCNLTAKAKQVQDILNNNKQYLFPNTVAINAELRMKLRDPKPNGGWGDLRDRTMCMSFFNSSISPFLR